MNLKNIQFKKPVVILSGVALFFAICTIIFALHTFRPEMNVVVVSDEVFDSYIQNSPVVLKNSKLVYVKASEQNTL